MNNAQTLEKGLTHPQIHVDYYKWLELVKNDAFFKKFIERYSSSPENFHAIAMWAWSASRETLAAKVKEYE